jgi:hypothetical protein
MQPVARTRTHAHTHRRHSMDTNAEDGTDAGHAAHHNVDHTQHHKREPRAT